MTAIKRLFEIGFGKIGEWAFTHSWLAVLLVLLINILLLSQLPKLTMDTSNESFFTQMIRCSSNTTSSVISSAKMNSSS